MEKIIDDYNLTKEQTEAIAEQIAGFFFGFWKNKSNEINIADNTRNGKAIVSESGLLRNFPEQTETMT